MFSQQHFPFNNALFIQNRSHEAFNRNLDKIKAITKEIETNPNLLESLQYKELTPLYSCLNLAKLAREKEALFLAMHNMIVTLDIALEKVDKKIAEKFCQEYYSPLQEVFLMHFGIASSFIYYDFNCMFAAPSMEERLAAFSKFQSLEIILRNNHDDEKNNLLMLINSLNGEINIEFEDNLLKIEVYDAGLLDFLKSDINLSNQMGDHDVITLNMIKNNFLINEEEQIRRSEAKIEREMEIIKQTKLFMQENAPDQEKQQNIIDNKVMEIMTEWEAVVKGKNATKMIAM